MPMDTVGTTLDLLKDTYNYNHWIYSLIRPYLGDSVLEVGAGIGNLTRFLLYCQNVVCVEPDPARVSTLHELAKAHLNLRVVQARAETFSADEVYFYPFDTVVCVNVLEHIEDDEKAARKMVEVLRQGGSLLLYVPAVSWAYGSIDVHLGHRRRYRKADLRELARNLNLRLAVFHYVNFIGLLGWWWFGRIRKEAQIDPQKARRMDRLVPYLSAMECLVRPPLGQSLLAVLENRPYQGGPVKPSCTSD